MGFTALADGRCLRGARVWEKRYSTMIACTMYLLLVLLWSLWSLWSLIMVPCWEREREMTIRARKPYPTTGGTWSGATFFFLHWLQWGSMPKHLTGWKQQILWDHRSCHRSFEQVPCSPHLSLVFPDGAHLCYALPCWYSYVVSLQKDMQSTSDCLLMQQGY